MSIGRRAAIAAGDTGPGVQRIYRRDEMPGITGYCIDYIYELIRAGQFPKPVPLGRHAVGWMESDLARWQAERIAARDTGQGAV
jgi:prophage regulatory protein